MSETIRKIGHGSYRQDVIDRILNPGGYFPASQKSVVSDANKLNGLMLLILREENPEIPNNGEVRRKIEEKWIKANENNSKYERFISAYKHIMTNMLYSSLELSDKFKKGEKAN